MIERIAAECLDAMKRQEKPVDLLEAFALPFPILVISEMLGASPDMIEEIGRLHTPLLSRETPADQLAESFMKMNELAARLVRAKHADPSQGLLGELVAQGGLDDQELAGLALLMMSAGHETTANLIALSVYFLLQNKELFKLMSSGPLTHAMANELLRYLSIVQFVSRAALVDVKLGEELIKAGDTVTISIPAANRDNECFEAPNTFDPERGENSHLAFGYANHQCVGHNLARAEIRIGIAELLRGLPGLRLAALPEGISTRDTTSIYGIHRLPVTW